MSAHTFKAGDRCTHGDKKRIRGTVEAVKGSIATVTWDAPYAEGRAAEIDCSLIEPAAHGSAEAAVHRTDADRLAYETPSQKAARVAAAKAEKAAK